MTVVQRIILLLVLFWFAEKVKGNECLLKFFDEPPTQLKCTPYDGSGDEVENDDEGEGEGEDDGEDDSYKVWKLRLACEVRVPVGSGPVQYEVHWFQRNNESNITDHGRPENFRKTDIAERVMFGTHLFNQKFTAAMLGDYWCQAILTDRQPPVYLSKSNILTVREPDYYNSSLPTCSDVQYIRKSRCISNITTSNTLYNLIPSIVTSITTLSSSSPLHTSVPLQSTTIMTSSISMATSSEEIVIPSPTALTPSSRPLNQQDILLPIAVGIGFGLLILGIAIVVMLAAILYKCKERKDNTLYPGTATRSSTRQLLLNSSTTQETNSTSFTASYELSTSPDIQSPVSNQPLVDIVSPFQEQSNEYSSIFTQQGNHTTFRDHHYSIIRPDFTLQSSTTLGLTQTQPTYQPPPIKISVTSDRYDYSQVTNPHRKPATTTPEDYSTLQHSLSQTQPVNHYNKLNHAVDQEVVSANDMYSSIELHQSPQYKTLMTSTEIEEDYNNPTKITDNTPKTGGGEYSELRSHDYLLLSSATTKPKASPSHPVNRKVPICPSPHYEQDPNYVPIKTAH